MEQAQASPECPVVTDDDAPAANLEPEIDHEQPSEHLSGEEGSEASKTAADAATIPVDRLPQREGDAEAPNVDDVLETQLEQVIDAELYQLNQDLLFYLIFIFEHPL